MMTSATPVLSVEDLVVEIPTRKGILTPVRHVSFHIAAGEILGMVGESGAGKSITGSAIIRLLEQPSRIAGGRVELLGERIDNLPEAAMRKLRGARIGMVFQDPLTSLNPLLTVGQQLIETAQLHLSLSYQDARKRALNILADVGIPASEKRIDAYPHEFSGGMRQRVVIALALIAEPQLVIADEPTTALDVSVQAQVLSLLKRMCRERNASVLLITHDMGVIAETTDRVAVMYAGNLLEIGPTREVLTDPRHPYTRGLMASTPATASATASINDQTPVRLSQIPGSMPDLLSVPSGCPFHPRCTDTLALCESRSPTQQHHNEVAVACHLYSSDAKSGEGTSRITSDE